GTIYNRFQLLIRRLLIFEALYKTLTTLTVSDLTGIPKQKNNLKKVKNTSFAKESIVQSL
ncbi:MAG: hypothetical protein FWC47_09120, partial [Oscillospiraceae bacterium]|nr:hypothetical protein [Oscillospiraceae bacterium]